MLVIMRAATSLLDLLAIICLGALVSNLITPGTAPKYFQNLFAFADFSNLSTLRTFAILVLLTFISKAFLSVVLLRKTARFLGNQEKLAISQILENVFSHGILQMRKTSKEETQFAIQVGAGAAYSGVLGNLATLISEASLFVVILIAFFTINFTATLALVFYLTTLATLVILLVGKNQARNSVVISAGTIQTNEKISDTLDNFREISTSGHRAKFLREILIARENVINRISNQNVLYGLPRHIIETAIIAGVLLAAIFTIGNLNVETASLIAIYATGSLRIVAALLPWQAALSQIRLSVPEARVALDLLNLRSRHPQTQLEVNIPKNFSLDFVNVSFSYVDVKKPAIKNMDLKILDKEFIGIIGSSGAGKSTLIDIALGLLKPDSGRVSIAKQNPEEIIHKFPGAVAYVPQKPSIFRATLAENIAIGEDLETMDIHKVNEVIRQVGLKERVGRLSHGVFTSVDKDSSFSGGELQRIALARALYAKPKLLVLDEISSSLDEESERNVINILNNLKGTATLIVIAHRHKTIAGADRIIEIKDGQILRMGKPSELLGKL